MAKVVFVGDGAVGKTCMQIAMTTGRFPEVYTPTVFGNYSTAINVDGTLLTLGIWDTGGQEDYDRLRPLSYPEADVVVITCSIDSPDSYQTIEFKWHPEIQHFCPGVPILLVATKLDLREDPVTISELARIKEKPCNREDGQKLAEKIGASAFLECSAKTGEGLKEILDGIAKIVMQDNGNRKNKTKTGCCTMF